MERILQLRLEKWLTSSKVIFYVTAFIYGSFLLHSGLMLKGCTAWWGKVDGNHYYVGNGKSYELYVEVSEAVFNFNNWHTALAFSVWPLCFLAAVAIKLIEKRIAALKEKDNTNSIPVEPATTTDCQHLQQSQ